MKKQKNTPIIVTIAAMSILILLLSPALTPSYSKDKYKDKDDDFKWQDAAKELDALPFPPAFIDSVKKAHTGGDTPRGLRKTDASLLSGNETLVYEVSWGMFRGGFMILSMEHQRDKGMIRLSGKFMSSSFVSSIYKIRNHMISWVDAEGFYPHFFEDHAREGSKHKMDAYTVFDNKNGMIYSRAKKLKEVESPPFAQDYISLLYYTRLMPLNPDDTFTVNLFSDKRTYPFKFKVHNKKEEVQTGAGTFNCVRLEPTIMGDGKVFGRGDKIEAWVSDDERKYPVMVKSKAKVGTINAKLIQVSR